MSRCSGYRHGQNPAGMTGIAAVAASGCFSALFIRQSKYLIGC
ncbi:lipoprotein, putative [Edwardsiella ictaluri 93-146]|uniref:Lipoprotein, putative n=1 Tax=Edwardsiella ictaluri (strain 93-146) TaxID=634503 RepID=C5BFG0_EDWI9|nr:lipoprotein, putative [Edwardsiella ictaluri 93-146]